MPTEVSELLTLAVRELGGTPRAGQEEMAEAVGSALGNNVHLLVQAGTGTGKSLGYLVPAVRHAVETGEKVVVATATLALQAQIVGRDLPKVARALRAPLGRTPTAAVLKGRRNYVCLQKLAGGYPDEASGMLFDLGADADSRGRDRQPSALGEEVARVRDWAQHTDSGDRDDLVPGVSDRAWSQVSVNSFDCLGARRCPMATECFAERAKVAAAAADVVVTNHALLAIDAFGDSEVLPDHGAVIVDEAHELQDRVTGALAGHLSSAMIRAAAASVRSHTAAPVLELEKAGEQLSDALGPLEAGWLPRGPGEELSAALAVVRDAARRALSDTTPGKEQDAEADAGRQMARARLTEVHELAERMADPGANDVIHLSREERRGEIVPAVHIAPLSVAGTMRHGLFAERTVIGTSATLTLGGSFDAIAGKIGLMGEGAPRWDSLDVGSPFDYRRQSILYLARHLPKPGRAGMPEETLEELAGLLEAAGGGMLGLFSSRRGAEEAAAALRARAATPILLQGEDGLASLVRRFAAEPAASLFGTLSLWQGVDVPGLSCRVVAIDRIPFPRPDDPLSQARSRETARHGGNAFMSIAASHAGIRLAQGVGRLIRTTDDRGVVAILDSRLATERYGGYLLRSLPEMWTTADGDIARASLERLRAAAAPPRPGP